MLEAALAYARAGVKIFPCIPKGKTPLTEHGHKDATSNEPTIRGWWGENPQANIGAPTGANGWTVLDIDTDDKDEVSEIALSLGDLPRTALQKTGKGRQVFFKAVEGMGPSVSIFDKVDVRSSESYVILPPSVHPNGNVYTWKVPLFQLSEMPGHLAARLKAQRVQPPARVDLDGPKLTVGARHRELFRIARSLAAKGVVESAVLEHLRAVNATRCDPPLSDEELAKTARGSDRYGYAEDAVALPKVLPPNEGAALFEDIIKEYKRLVWFPNEWTYKIAALFVLQTYLKDALSSVWYIAFKGPKGSGKTTALEVTMELSKDGVLSNNVSPAAMARIAETRTMFVDELDEMEREKKATMEGILRAAYRKGQPYIRCEGKDNVPTMYQVYGPKGYSLRSEAEDALMSRTYAARTERAPPDRARRMLVANAMRDMKSLADRLSAWATPERVASFKEDVQGIWMSAEFEKKLDALIESGALPRDIEVAATCLSIAMAMGLDVEVEMKSAMDEQVLYEDSEVDDFRDEVMEVWQSMGKPLVAKRKDLLSAINLHRADQKMMVINRKQFTKMLLEIGARDGIEVKRGGHGSKHMLYFSKEFLARLVSTDESVSIGVQNDQGSVDTFGHLNTRNPTPPVEGVNESISVYVSPPAMNQLERFKAVKELASKMGEFIEGDLADKAALLGIANGEVNSILRHCIEAGTIIEPTPYSGRYRYV